jgi:hypothetical protein
VIARVLEERGLSTVALSLVREHSVRIKPPRTVWVPFPFGISVGHRNDAREQRAVLDLAFSTLTAPDGPVLLDFVAADRPERAAPIQASGVEVEAHARTVDFAAEVEGMRDHMLARADKHRKIGLSRVDPKDFGTLARWLARYASGEESDFPGRPADVELLPFIRFAVEDLRVMYALDRMHAHPDESSDDRQVWLLGATAFGIFLRTLRDYLEASDDPKVKAAGFGIAR